MSEWVTVTFDAIATFKKGINYKSEDYCEKGSGYPFVTIKCFIKGGGYEPTGLQYFDGYWSNSDLLSPEEIIFAVTDLTRAVEYKSLILLYYAYIASHQQNPL